MSVNSIECFCKTLQVNLSTVRASLTLLHTGVQLGDLVGQAVDTVLETVCTHIKGVGFIKKFSKNIFCMFTCKKPELGGKGGKKEKEMYVKLVKDRIAAYCMAQDYNKQTWMNISESIIFLWIMH